ncbi:histidinol-phosphate aminotransferase [Pyrolobus fumarii 1A]|uniref:Histidinol-phosphate aminotransferase n=1 Tax=Pyrolobus fumarii (strain DSM 11204 / 1A) TaxID=694429 RepID=G0EH79_PYRF1|nr:histidinol-phosphate transaminase [Pyrolobus fumarii]AEM39303.1 histidinol-phosphate aminotransferase [Pyrolobus fumarii 1A]
MSVREFAKDGFLDATPYPLPKRHPGITYLDLNECPFEPPAFVQEAVCKAARRGNRYPTLDDYYTVERLIADYAGLEPDYVVLTAGGDEALRAIFDVFVGPGDRVVLLEPGFAMTRFYTIVRGGVYQAVKLREEGRRFLLDENELLEVASGARMIVIENPHNPTGSLLANEELAIRLLDETDAIVVFDEAYYEFAGLSIARLTQRYDRLIVVRTLSKAFCLAGYRVGYILAHPTASELLRKALTPFNLSVVQLAAAQAALENRDYVEKVIAHVNSEKDRMTKRLEELGLRVYESYTNFLLVKTGVPDIHELLAKHGVVVKQIKSLGSDYIRVTIGTREENDKFIHAIEQAVASVTR